MNKSNIKDYSAGLVKSIKSGKLTLEEAVIESSAATGCTKDFARKILSECLAENKAKKPIKSSADNLPKEVYYMVVNGAKMYYSIDYDKVADMVQKINSKPGPRVYGPYTEDDPEEIQELYEVGYLSNSRKPVKPTKKSIKSGRYIKSGTSNFGSNDDVFGYSFPLVTYIAENYYYDEETDSETEERDYDADDWEYRDALDEAKDLADEMDIPQYDDYSEPYLCHEPFMIKFRDGYYEGLWIEVKEGTDEEDIYNTNEYGSYYDGGRQFTEEEMNKYADKLNEYFNKLCSDYGWQKLGVAARFSNGETWYSKIDNSRKPIKSGMTYEQALDMFTSEGKPWGDYWSMQYDWTAFIDSLEKDGVVDYEEARWWDNPCTPETFNEWAGRSNDDEYDEYYEDDEITNSRKPVKSAKKPIKSMRYNI